MKIRLAHHYWQNNESAQWNPKQFPFPDIEQELKGSYVILEAEKPKWKKYGNITVFFDYRPTKDIYGRAIVPITFAFVPDCRKPEVCQPVIARKLASATNSKLEIEVSLPPGAVGEKKVKSKKNFIIAGICIALLLFILPFFKTGKQRAPKKVIVPQDRAEAVKIAQEAVMQEAQAGKNFPDKNGETPAPSGKMKEVELKEPEEQAASKIAATQQSVLICKGLEENILPFLEKCAARFIKDYCANRTGNKNYARWLSDNNPAECSRSKEFTIKSSLSDKFVKELNRIKNHGK